MGNAQYLIGRQPILNRNEEIVAYELLFRSPGAKMAVVKDASHATATVIVSTLSGFGIEDILGQHTGFINVDAELLMDDSLHLLPKSNMVLELLETLDPTPDLIEQCRSLKENGFTLALDDHTYSPDYHELYELVDIVKVDLMQTPLNALPEAIQQFRRYPLQLLAEKVETQEEFRRCLELGFDMFQGYYFAKPSIMEKKRLDSSGNTLLKLMRLLNEDAELDEIEGAFRISVGLTYKLLLLVNSVGTGTRNKIETVRHAISMLGRTQIKRWVQLALFAGNDGRGIENPMVDMAAVRASFMEHLTYSHRFLKSERDGAEKAFITGILSILERVYNDPMDEIVDKLNLSEEIKAALISREGCYGKLLHLAEMVESRDCHDLSPHLEEMGVSLENIIESQTKAYAWRCRMA